jgi:phosphoglucosamine mutase
MRKYPQVLINVPLQQGQDFIRSEAVEAAVKIAEDSLADQGRVLLRPSGTEPLVRVMVEGTHKQQVRQVAEQLADAVAAAQEK